MDRSGQPLGTPEQQAERAHGVESTWLSRGSLPFRDWISLDDQQTVLVVLLISLLGCVVMQGWISNGVARSQLPPRTSLRSIDLNRANGAQLRTLPGIGPSMAARIVEYRERRGAFRSIDELDAVSGIGPKTLARIRPWVRVEWNTEALP